MRWERDGKHSVGIAATGFRGSTTYRGHSRVRRHFGNRKLTVVASLDGKDSRLQTDGLGRSSIGWCVIYEKSQYSTSIAA